MSVEVKTFNKTYVFTPDQAVPGAANRYDQYRLEPASPLALFSRASLKVLSSSCLETAPRITSMPPAGKRARDQLVTVEYRMLLPMSHARYELTVTMAVPTKLDGSEEDLEVKSARMMMFEHIDFGGRYRMVENAEPALTRTSAGGNESWDNRISSFVVLTGSWKLFRHEDFQGSYQPPGLSNGRFGPGLYKWVMDSGIGNDDVSSLLSV